MCRFLDGPAAGVSLMLKRAPLLLRVVKPRGADKGKWDAVDQLDDTPERGEEIHVYLRVTKPTVAMIDGSKGGKRWGMCAEMADYRLFDRQPDDDVMRDTARWQAWCREQQERVKKLIGMSEVKDGDA